MTSPHATHTVSCNPLTDSQRERGYMDTENWITVREAQPILKVTTTQGVWNVITRAERQHGVTVKRRNIGTEDMPRYLLDKADVETVAKAMGKL